MTPAAHALRSRSPAPAPRPPQQQQQQPPAAGAAAAAAAAAPVCRYCFDHAAPAEFAGDACMSELILPCRCRDFIHRGCLQHWREVQPAAAHICGACQAPFATQNDFRRAGLVARTLMENLAATARRAPHFMATTLATSFANRFLTRLAIGAVAMVLSLLGRVALSVAGAVWALLIDTLNGGDVVGWTLEMLIQHALIHLVTGPLVVLCIWKPWRAGAPPVFAPNDAEIATCVAITVVATMLVWNLLPLYVQAVAVAVGALTGFLAFALPRAAAALTVVAHRPLPTRDAVQ